jgi:uncharacterized protein YebE (UPF0316 family)
MGIMTLFIICNVINVIIQTVKSICTIRCGKILAAVINAIAYGYYTYIVVLTMCELSLLVKIVIVGLCNLVGVYLVKFFEEKKKKDKLWKIELTSDLGVSEKIKKFLTDKNIPFTMTPTENLKKEFVLFNVFCYSQKESILIKKIIEMYEIKYFVTESKSL